MSSGTRLIETINDSNGSPAAVGQSLLLSTSQLNAIGLPGSFHIWPVTVTNTGAAAQSVEVSGRTFGPAQNVQTGSVVLQDGSSPELTRIIAPGRRRCGETGLKQRVGESRVDLMPYGRTPWS
jgi:hypothetical protein